MRKLSVVASLMLLGFISANAAGTAAGTTVSNSASLSYSVGGATQPTVNTTAAATFVVDKKIDFSVVHNDDPKHVITTPGATEVERTFTLENTTNEVQDFTLVATNLVDDIYDEKTDNSNVSDIKISFKKANGTWSAFAGGTVTIPSVGIDGTVNIKVQSTVPNTNVDGNIMNIQLEATAVKSGTTDPEKVTGSGVEGTLSADRKDTMDVVLGEGAGVNTFANVQFDGKYSAWAGYIINSPVLSLTKSSCVYKDLVSGVSANAKRIPGATITYLLDIKNTGSTNASDINITDVLPAKLDGTTVTAVKTFDNQASCVCDGGVAGGGVAATSSVSTQTLTVSSLTAIKAKHNCVSFQVNIK